MVKNPNRKAYPKLVAYSFLIGLHLFHVRFVWYFILYSAIINRMPVKAHPETIYDYFKAGEWQVTIIWVIYLFRFFTVFPNFTTVSKYCYWNLVLSFSTFSEFKSKKKLNGLSNFTLFCLPSSVTDTHSWSLNSHHIGAQWYCN